MEGKQHKNSYQAISVSLEIEIDQATNIFSKSMRAASPSAELLTGMKSA